MADCVWEHRKRGFSGMSGIGTRVWEVHHLNRGTAVPQMSQSRPTSSFSFMKDGDMTPFDWHSASLAWRRFGLVFSFTTRFEPDAVLFHSIYESLAADVEKSRGARLIPFELLEGA